MSIRQRIIDNRRALGHDRCQVCGEDDVDGDGTCRGCGAANPTVADALEEWADARYHARREEGR